jgi:hypothetical protein
MVVTRARLQFRSNTRNVNRAGPRCEGPNVALDATPTQSSTDRSRSQQ